MAKRGKFNIERKGFNFIVKPGHKETHLTFKQAHTLANFLKNNMKLFSCYFVEIKWYIKFLEEPSDYFSFDEETGNWRTWFRPYLYGEENAVEVFKDIFSEKKHCKLDFYDRMSCNVYCKDKNYLQKCCEKYYNTVIIPYIEQLFGTTIYDIVLEYRAMSEEEKEILNYYY